MRRQLPSITIALLVPFILAGAADRPEFKNPAVREAYKKYAASKNDYRTALKRGIAMATRDGDAEQAEQLGDALADLDAPDAGRIDGNSAVFRGHRYKLVDVAVTWQQASRICQALGGHLISIEDAGEYEFTKRLIGDSCIYIGATDAGTEGEFRWTNGGPIGRAPWAAGEPDNRHGGEAYAVMNYMGRGQFWDVPNTFPRVDGFVIEWD